MSAPEPTATPTGDKQDRGALVPYVAPSLDPWLTRAARAVGMVDAGDLAEFAVRVEQLAARDAAAEARGFERGMKEAAAIVKKSTKPRSLIGKWLVLELNHRAKEPR